MKGNDDGVFVENLKRIVKPGRSKSDTGTKCAL